MKGTIKITIVEAINDFDCIGVEGIINPEAWNGNLDAKEALIEKLAKNLNDKLERKKNEF